MNINLSNKPYLLVGLSDLSFSTILEYAEYPRIGLSFSGSIKIDTGCRITRINLKNLSTIVERL